MCEQPPPGFIPASLRPHVTEMYGYSAHGMEPGVHRGLPSDRLTVVFSMDRPLRTAASAEAWHDGVRDEQWVTIGGLHTRAAMVEQPGAWCGIQLSLDPVGVESLLGVPAADLPVASWDARDLLGSEVDRAVDALHAAPDWAARYAVVADVLLRRARDVGRVGTPRTPSSEVRHAWGLLTTRPDLGVGQVAREVGLSRRRLSSLISAEVGHPPKTVQRLARFDAARRLVTRSHLTGISLASVAARTGYYDQSHLVHDFHEFAGLAPSAWLVAEFPNLQVGPDLGAQGSWS